MNPLIFLGLFVFQVSAFAAPTFSEYVGVSPDTDVAIASGDLEIQNLSISKGSVQLDASVKNYVCTKDFQVEKTCTYPVITKVTLAFPVVSNKPVQGYAFIQTSDKEVSSVPMSCGRDYANSLYCIIDGKDSHFSISGISL